MALTPEAVLALAPDAASAKAARTLTAPARWPLLGANAVAVWGECQGSGAKPYQTQVDWNGPAFRCSCPSRKFPCKHGLALLLLQAQSPQHFASTEAPAWVSQWLAARLEKAEKKETRPAEPSAAPADPLAAAKREAQRWQRIEAAAQELQRWLSDQLARGLGALDAEALKTWQTMAARMVDAQAPGLALRLREAAALVLQGEDWPEQTLARLGLLQLACDAVQRRSALPSALQAELRIVLGWPYDKAEILQSAPHLHDRWTVLGVATQERDDKLIERRVWLHGEQSTRRAWLLDHAFGGRGFESVWLVGTGVEASLAFFPGSSALRALLAEPAGRPGHPTWPTGTLAEEWQRVAQRVAASPWVQWHPLVVPEAVLLPAADGLLLVADRQTLKLTAGEADTWTLLAFAGGKPVQLMGEWDGQTLNPLSAWHASAVGPVWHRSQT